MEEKNDYLVDIFGIVVSALVNPVALILQLTEEGREVNDENRDEDSN